MNRESPDSRTKVGSSAAVNSFARVSYFWNSGIANSTTRPCPSTAAPSIVVSLPGAIAGSPLPAGLFEVSDACRCLTVSLGVFPTLKPATSAFTRVDVLKESSATRWWVSSICCLRSSNTPSARVDAVLTLIKSPKRMSLACARERPPTTVSELATLDSIIRSCGRTSRPPIAAALPRKTNLRLKSMGCVT